MGAVVTTAMRNLIRIIENVQNPTTRDDTIESPAFEHDCEKCIFVGGDTPQDGEPRVNQVDMYLHRSPNRTTLIRRYSSEPSDYQSQELSQRTSDRFQRVAAAANLRQPTG